MEARESKFNFKNLFKSKPKSNKKGTNSPQPSSRSGSPAVGTTSVSIPKRITRAATIPRIESKTEPKIAGTPPFRPQTYTGSPAAGTSSFLLNSRDSSSRGSSSRDSSVRIGTESKVEPKTDILPTYKSKQKDIKIGVIGSGWYGVHTALVFAQAGYIVSLVEKNSQIFSGTSGTFGIRIHTGQHYPRSYATRKSCHDGFFEMQAIYPEVCQKHSSSVYALGKTDADKKPSKVNRETFDSVCREYQYKGEFDLHKSPFNPDELIAAYDIAEPSALLGEPLRVFFRKKLQEQEVKVIYNFEVTQIKKVENLIYISNGQKSEQFNFVIDATGFQQSFLPLTKPLPFNINVFYQPCLALKYRDTKPGDDPFSFIVMDGWYPCLMPCGDNTYIMTHGKWTILASYTSADEAHKALAAVDDTFVESKIKPDCEREMARFWKEPFLGRFKYVGWVGSVLAKIKTETEFRGSVVFQEPTLGVIYQFPAKITGCFEAGREGLNLVLNQNVIHTNEGYGYIKGGVLDLAKAEITEPITTDARNTCSLQTFQKELAARQPQPQPQPKQTLPTTITLDDRNTCALPTFELGRVEKTHIFEACREALQPQPKPQPKQIAPPPETPRPAFANNGIKTIVLISFVYAIKKMVDEEDYKLIGLFFGLLALSVCTRTRFANNFSIKNLVNLSIWKQPRNDADMQTSITFVPK